MTRLDAIKKILAKAHYANESRVLRHIRRILADEDFCLEIKNLEKYEDEIQQECELILKKNRQETEDEFAA